MTGAPGCWVEVSCDWADKQERFSHRDAGDHPSPLSAESTTATDRAGFPD